VTLQKPNQGRNQTSMPKTQNKTIVSDPKTCQPNKYLTKTIKTQRRRKRARKRKEKKGKGKNPTQQQQQQQTQPSISLELEHQPQDAARVQSRQLKNAHWLETTPIRTESNTIILYATPSSKKKFRADLSLCRQTKHRVRMVFQFSLNIRKGAFLL